MKTISPAEFIATGAALFVGNCLYQVLTKFNWGEAFERTWFQVFALGFLYFTSRKGGQS